MLLVPTRAICRALDHSHMTWKTLVDLVKQAECEQPMYGHGTERRVLLSGQWKIYAASGTYDDQPCYYLLGLGRRQQADLPVEPVVGCERPRPVSRKRGGAGTLLPTSYDEILRAIDDAPGWRWENAGRRHIAVYGPNGERGTIPSTASDWRSLANNVKHLRAMGLDVKRKQRVS